MERHAHLVARTTRRWVEEAERGQVAILLRHAARGELPNGSAGNELPITDDGARLATELGRQFGQLIGSVHTSPVRRCVETAACIVRGARTSGELILDHLLGAPGVYVSDAALAGRTWDRLGNAGVIRHLIDSDDVLPGLEQPAPAARRLLQHMLACTPHRPGLHVFVTHDSLVAVTVARLFGLALPEEAWPQFLEGAMFWREGARVHSEYRTFRARWDGPR